MAGGSAPSPGTAATPGARGDGKGPSQAQPDGELGHPLRSETPESGGLPAMGPPGQAMAGGPPAAPCSPSRTQDGEGQGQLLPINSSDPMGQFRGLTQMGGRAQGDAPRCRHPSHQPEPHITTPLLPRGCVRRGGGCGTNALSPPRALDKRVTPQPTTCRKQLPLLEPVTGATATPVRLILL